MQIITNFSNVLKYKLEDGSWFCLRTFGTEPNIKFYFGVKLETMTASQMKLKGLTSAVMNRAEHEILV